MKFVWIAVGFVVANGWLTVPPTAQPTRSWMFDCATAKAALAPLSWTETTPAAGDVPATPFNGQTFADVPNQIEWMHCLPRARWLAKNAGLVRDDPRVEFNLLLSVPPGSHQYLVEFPFFVPTLSELVLIVAAEWTTSWAIGYRCPRWCVITFGTAPSGSTNAVAHLKGSRFTHLATAQALD